MLLVLTQRFLTEFSRLLEYPQIYFRRLTYLPSYLQRFAHWSACAHSNLFCFKRFTVTCLWKYCKPTSCNRCKFPVFLMGNFHSRHLHHNHLYHYHSLSQSTIFQDLFKKLHNACSLNYTYALIVGQIQH